MHKKINLEKLSKKSKTYLKKWLWDNLVKPYIRKKYGNTCYTCGAKNLTGSNWHTGHCIPSSTCGILLRYDEINLRPQCYSCNINKGGNGAIFLYKLEKEFGSAYKENLFLLKNQASQKDNKQFYLDKIIEYYDKSRT